MKQVLPFLGMRFIWDEVNVAHIARHGVEPWFAEKIYSEGRATIARSRFQWRYLVEATIDEKHYRLVFDVLENNRDAYVVTAFPIKKRTI